LIGDVREATKQIGNGVAWEVGVAWGLAFARAAFESGFWGGLGGEDGGGDGDGDDDGDIGRKRARSESVEFLEVKKVKQG
jgi:hypothetical protein